MAKRVRGSVRPGQRRPISRRPARPAAPAESSAPVTPRPAGLTDAESARAAELEAQILAEEREAEQARQRARERMSAPRNTVPAGALAMRPEEEYAYVARDLKDIARIAVVLFTILIGLWILIDVVGVFSIT
jgi:hypothetical protein